MRKLYLVLLALTLSVATLAAAALPAAADPGDNKPVAWVNFTGTGSGGDDNPGNNPNHVLPNAQILVKRLADGSTVGHMKLRFLKLGIEIVYEPLESYFELPGVANVLTLAPPNVIHPASDHYWWWRIEDNGEPGGANDAFIAYLYAGVGRPSWPPAAGPWVPIFPYQKIAPDNIQVKITDAYVP